MKKILVIGMNNKIVGYHLHSDGRLDITVEINGDFFQGQLMVVEVREV